MPFCKKCGARLFLDELDAGICADCEEENE